ncbi:MAG TPA: uracil-DNA glycosylase family protein [Kiritimatiellia bacterium]|nr:uracil-DNA glycosylase family protein [Kiritimatiellia bacterium]
MSEWTDILDGLTDQITLLKELGLRTVELDPAVIRALGRRAAPAADATRPPPDSQPPTVPAPIAPEPFTAPRVAPIEETQALSPEARRAALDELAARIASCTACPLHQSRNRTVPGQGNFNSPDILFIGEAPGAEEDQQGVPFVGAAGQLLTRMIAAMGYTRDQVFIANICKCRPPRNRPPTPDEAAICLIYLRQQIRLIRPKTIILLGGTAIKALLNTQVGVNRIQGEWTQYEGIPVMPTFHPSYLLRFEPAKRDAWQALKRVLAHLGKPVPSSSR